MSESVDKQWRKYQKSLEGEFQFAASVGLTDSAFQVRDALGRHLDDISGKGG